MLTVTCIGVSLASGTNGRWRGPSPDGESRWRVRQVPAPAALFRHFHHFRHRFHPRRACRSHGASRSTTSSRAGTSPGQTIGESRSPRSGSPPATRRPGTMFILIPSYNGFFFFLPFVFFLFSILFFYFF